MASQQQGFKYQGSPALPPSAYGSAGGDIQGVWKTLMENIQGGRPGAMDWLQPLLSSLGQVEGANLQRNQYETMQPYATDQAQQGRYAFNAGMPYMTDQYEAARQANQRAQEQWKAQYPYMQQQYQWMGQQLDNPYINQSLKYGR